MFRNLFVIVLVAAGLLLVVNGAYKWLDNNSVRTAVATYVHALRTGNREAALDALHPQQRVLVEEQMRNQPASMWTPDLDVEYRVHSVSINGDRARAKLWIEKEGYVIQPTLSLARSETGHWKIDRVDPIAVDPVWEDRQEKQSRAEGRDLANELGEALRGKPGVSIERAPLDDIGT